MERMVVYVITEKDDYYELPLFIGDTLKECAYFLRCSLSDVWYSIHCGCLIQGKYYVNSLVLD